MVPHHWVTPLGFAYRYPSHPARHPPPPLHPHRYIPTVGQPGQHDASYTTFCPPSPGKAPVIADQTIDPADFDKVKLEITPRGWEKLPTLWNVVDGSAGIPRAEVLEVALQTFQGASDLSATQRVD